MKHIPPATKVFLGLFVITFLLTYVALSLSTYEMSYFPNPEPAPHIVTAQQEPQADVDTSDWKTYHDKSYPLAFLYPKNWTIKGAVNKSNYYDVDLNPGPTSPDMHIYISHEGYYALEGLKQTPYPVGNRSGFTVSNNLVGIKVGDYYYTFDGSMNNKQADEFSALISTVTFQ